MGGNASQSSRGEVAIDPGSVWLWAPVAFALGSAAWFEMPFEPSPVLFPVALLLCLLGYRKYFAKDDTARPLVEIFIVLVFAFSLGISYAALRTYAAQPVLIDAPMDRVMVEGWVEDVSVGQSGERILLRTHAILGLSRDETPAYVRLTHRSKLVVGPGRFVRCYSSLRPPPARSLPGDYAFRRQAYFDGPHAVGFAFGACRPGVIGAPEGFGDRLQLDIASLRRSVALDVSEAAGERGGGFAAALISGDRSLMAIEDQDALRSAGLAHLLAISGLHMGLAAGILYFIGFRGLALILPLARRYPVQKPAAALALAGITLYLVLSGAAVSAQRAWIMAAIALTAILLDRPAISLHTLGLAMLGVVLLSPVSVVGPGFQMSFAATAALIRTYQSVAPRFERDRTGARSWLRRWAVPLLLTSLVAGTATAPFALYHFDRVATYGYLANIAVSPIISLVSAPLGAVGALLMPLGLGDLPLRGFGASLALVLDIAHLAGGQESSIYRPGRLLPGSFLLFVTLALAAWCIHGGIRLAAIPAACAFLLWLSASEPGVIVSPSGHVFTKQDQGWSGVRLWKGEGLKPLRFSDVEILDCRDTCTMTVADGRVLTIDKTTESLRLWSDAGAADIPFGQLQGYPLALQLQLDGKGYRTRPLTATSCRQWSSMAACGDALPPPPKG